MKKVIVLVSALLLWCSNAIFSQGQLDAYKYSQTDILGTARYMSMGGAFGALGGDISVMGVNPAGLGIYKRSEIVTSLNVNTVDATSGWGEQSKASKTNFYFGNIAYVNYFPTSSDAGLVSWNFGFSYNRLKDYNRTYTSRGGGNGRSITDYVAERASRAGYHKDKLLSTNSYDPYSNPAVSDWLSILGYNSVFIEAYNDNPNKYYSTFGSMNNGVWQDFRLSQRELTVKESGAIDQYNVALGFNVSDFLFFGADLAITDINYHYNSFYRELFDPEPNKLTLENNLKTEGSGYQVNAGVILSPVSFFRIGAAYNSPTWYKMSDTYSATAYSDTYFWEKDVTANAPDSDYPGVYDYRYSTPGKWILSAAAIIGQTALLSADYELTNYRHMNTSDVDGIDNKATNDEIAENFAAANTLRLGAELRVTPQFAIRAGAAIASNPMNEDLRTGKKEVFTVGTVPHYTLDNTMKIYSAGLGYRFTPNFYMDLACLLKAQEENLYAFSNMFDTNKQTVIESKPAALKTSTTRMVLTLGYKF
jgi:long-subunit fatty acid transport protein